MKAYEAWPVAADFGPGPSIFNGEALPDFIDPPVEGIEPCVQASVVKVEYVPAGQKSENPVMRFHIEQHLLDRMTDSNYNVPQDVHRIPRSKREDYHDRQVACSGPQPFAWQQISRLSLAIAQISGSPGRRQALDRCVRPEQNGRSAGHRGRLMWGSFG
jgi:hypothetical protein